MLTSVMMAANMVRGVCVASFDRERNFSGGHYYRSIVCIGLVATSEEYRTRTKELLWAVAGSIWRT